MKISPRRYALWAGLLSICALCGLLSWQVAPGLAARIKSVWQEEKEKTSEHENREERERWFWFQRAYPNNSIAADARERAWANRPASTESEEAISARSARTAAQQQSGLARWVSIGPQPSQSNYDGNQFSGRINTIAVSPSDPKLILVGRGGLWRSTDGGENFVSVIDDQLQVYVRSIAFSKSNPNIVYAALGDLYYKYYAGYLGNGVLKSADAGRTWRRISDGSLPPGLFDKILVDPNNSEKVFLGMTFSSAGNGEGGFYVSTDGGVKWTRTFRCEAIDILTHPTNSQIVYLSAKRVFEPNQPAATLYKSSDGGSTWTIRHMTGLNANRSFLLQLADDKARPDSINALIVGFKGNDGAEKPQGVYYYWEPLNSNPNGYTLTEALPDTQFDSYFQFDYDPFFAVAPNNALYVGMLHVYKSGTSGFDFNNISAGKMHVDHHAMAFAPNDSNTVYFGNDGGLYKTTDGAQTFTPLNRTLSMTEFYPGYAVHPTNALRAYGGTQDNGIQRRLQSPTEWEVLLGGDGGGCVINPVNLNQVLCRYVGGPDFRRFTFENGAVAKVEYPRNTSEEDNKRMSFNEPLATDGQTGRVYLGTYRLLATDNLGDSWSVLGVDQDLTKGGNDKISVVAVARTNRNIIYTGSEQGRVMVTTDRGAVWRDATAGLPNRYVTSIEISRADPTIAYVTFSGTGSGHVYKTEDTGRNWKNISGKLPDIPVNDLLIDPLSPSTLYVATDVGVYRTTNEGEDLAGQGQDWSDLNRGLPNGILARNLVAQPEGVIQLTTWGRGVYQLDRGRVCDAIPIRNTSVNGSLSESGCLASAHVYPAPADRYSFSAQAGQKALINLTSTAIDAYLHLIAPDGRVLAQDDDSGGGLNPRIPANGGLLSLPQTGVYTIEVTSNDIRAAGAYTLSLKGPLEEAIVDDGSIEVALGGGETSFVNRVTPSSYPATINTVSIFFSATVGNRVGEAITVLVGTNADGDENINGANFQTLSASVQKLEQFNVFNAPSVTITSGDFVIGVRKTGNVGVDVTPPIRRRSYLSGNGVNFTLYENVPGIGSGNLPIRTEIVNQIGQVASVSAASFRRDTQAAEQINALFGVNLAARVEAAATLPLPTTLAGTRVLVRDSFGVDRSASLFFVAPGQINYQIPPGTALGPAQVTVLNERGVISVGQLVIGGVGPGLFTANANGQGAPAAVLFRARNGQITTEPVARFSGGQFVPAPIDLGPEGDLLALALYATGIRNRTDLSAVTVQIGGVDAPVGFAGPAPGFVGLEQINVTLPRSLRGRGDVDLALTVDGKTANLVRLNIR